MIGVLRAALSDEAITAGRVPTDVFSSFVNATPDFAIFALDKDGTVASWNPGAERIKGWKAEEIVGRHFSLFYPLSDVEAHKPRYVLRRAAQNGRFEDEGWRVRKDGSMFWANIVVTPIRASDGTVRGFVKVTRDLTARRHAEEAIRQSEERYRILIESVKDYAIFILDPTGHVMSWNQGAERLKGYAPDEIIGRHFSTFYTQADRDRQHPAQELTIALSEGRYEEEGWRVRKDGSMFWASVTITALFDSDKRHMGFAKVTRDLTERKRAEETLRARADSYAQLNRELDAFAHSVAHDLRAPARAVHELSDVLLRDAAARLTRDDTKTLRAIHRSSEKMALLVQDLLDLSLTTRQDPNIAPADVSAIARQAADEVRARHPQRTIEFQIADGMRASADARLLQVAFGNLFDNAVKFSPKDPAIIEVREDPKDGEAVFSVRDHGIGFDPAHASRLFEPFSRLPNAEQIPGTGIGLTIVHRIIRRHGGRLWAQGAVGGGATFLFTLPRG